MPGGYVCSASYKGELEPRTSRRSRRASAACRSCSRRSSVRSTTTTRPTASRSTTSACSARSSCSSSSSRRPVPPQARGRAVALPGRLADPRAVDQVPPRRGLPGDRRIARVPGGAGCGHGRRRRRPRPAPPSSSSPASCADLPLRAGRGQRLVSRPVLDVALHLVRGRSRCFIQWMPHDPHDLAGTPAPTATCRPVGGGRTLALSAAVLTDHVCDGRDRGCSPKGVALLLPGWSRSNPRRAAHRSSS